MKIDRITGRLGAAVVAVSLAAGPAGAGDMSATVAELCAAWDDALNSGDAEAVAAMYAEDGKVVTGTGEVKTGRDEIEALFKGFIDSGFGEHEIAIAEVRSAGTMAYMTGDWSGVGGDGKSYGGKIVTIYEKLGAGDWKAVLHMWN